MADNATIPPDAEEARILAAGIVETIRQPLLILAEDLSVHSANRAFYQAFQVDRAQTEGRLIYELGNRQWDIPGLRELLSHVLPQEKTVEQFEVQHTFEDIGEKIMLVSARTLRRPGARPSLILVAIEDVTEQRRSRWLLEHQKELAEKIIDTVREPLLILHQDLRVQSANRAFYDTFEVEPTETEGRLVYDLGHGQWDIPDLRRLLTEILPDNDFFEDFEVEHDFPTIGPRVMLLNARRVDHLQLILLAIEDVSERRRVEREREMLVGELNHRVKNSFAVMRALAAQGDGARSSEDDREVFLGRMDALTRTHDLLFESHWQGTELRSLANALQPFAGGRAEALQLEGAPVGLSARQALSVGLVLHELATNAAKYGAWSVPEGRVHLSWQVEGKGRRLRLLWQERGGPPVTAPPVASFGTELIRRAFGFELGGTADLAFEREGLRFEATFPLS
ncbi:MAG TPA: PAS domain-containing protein [Vicinamibacterales bacterium]|nr:PAS domain-containing protein [Vicinamibacterales bacterium]